LAKGLTISFLAIELANWMQLLIVLVALKIRGQGGLAMEGLTTPMLRT
jgi:hypothetical protein